MAAVFFIALLVMAKAGTWHSNFNRYIDGGQNLVKKTAESLEKIAPIFKSMDLSDQVEPDIQQFTDRFAGKNLLPLALQLLKWLPSLLLIPYFIYFMLNDSARLKQYIIKSVPNAFFEKALLLFSRLDDSLQNYFRGLLLLTLLDTVALRLDSNCWEFQTLFFWDWPLPCWRGFPISGQSSVALWWY